MCSNTWLRTKSPVASTAAWGVAEVAAVRRVRRR
ncbi:MAG: hypothetical protein D6741_00845 [Planctomycetota bacterium]|nr:MAG: hypothetical protein D6741_00845 [Planctomycetota bacterium]